MLIICGCSDVNYTKIQPNKCSMFKIFAFSAKDTPENLLPKGSEVRVVGPSTRKGHLIVDHKNICYHVPYQMLDIKVNSILVVALYITGEHS